MCLKGNPWNRNFFSQCNAATWTKHTYIHTYVHTCLQCRIHFAPVEICEMLIDLSYYLEFTFSCLHFHIIIKMVKKNIDILTEASFSILNLKMYWINFSRKHSLWKWSVRRLKNFHGQPTCRNAILDTVLVYQEITRYTGSANDPRSVSWEKTSPCSGDGVPSLQHSISLS